MTFRVIKEFAVEPALLSDWKDCRYLIEKFGFHRGRVISDFPEKNWMQLVIDALDRHSTMNRKRVVAKLEKYKSAVVASGRDCQDPENWLQSAEDAHKKKPFHAILAERNPNEHPRVIVYDDDFDEDLSKYHDLFICPTERSMPKDIDGFNSTAGQLIGYSKRIIFVDHYFFNNNTFEKWGEPLKALLSNIPRNLLNKIMPRFCTSACLDENETALYRQGKIERNLPKFVPRGLKLEILLLGKVAGQDTHNRYILTELGGIKFPWGLDLKPDGTRDVVNLMDPDVRENKFQEFSELDGGLMEPDAGEAKPQEVSETYSKRHPVVKSFVVVGSAAERASRPGRGRN